MVFYDVMVSQEKAGGYNRSVKVGSLLNGLLAKFGLSRKLDGWGIVRKWSEIVGEKNAEHSTALRFSEDTLLVKVTDAVWRHELSLDADRILKEIHKHPGGSVVKKIHFVS